MPSTDLSPLTLALAGSGLVALGGLAALLLARAPRLAAAVAAASAALGGAAGLVAAIAAISGGWSGELAAAWEVPGGALVVGLDPLSGFFLVPLCLLGPLAALYGRRYLEAAVVPAAELNLLVAAMSLVLLARNALLFLVAWEGMTLLAYLLVSHDHGDPAVRRAGWAYLIASHVALIALFALFVALGAGAGGVLDFASIADAWRGQGAAAVLFLALFGFGIKSGVAGLHVWLPEAHAAAPSHVSALMSGVLIKLGLYGLLRVALFVSPGSWFAVSLMILGASGAIFGIVLALDQRDIKRVLAYSSVENVGVILLALGLGFWARNQGEPRLAAIAFAGGLLHVWNHAAMKGLLFLAAGSVVHATGTRDIEKLGGLLRRMPQTGKLLLTGSVAIAALPPLNGITSEWLVYRALTQVGVSGSTAAALAAVTGAAALALVGGLAALCFVRLVGVTLLGAPRSQPAATAHESPLAMTGPMMLLGLVCVAGAVLAPLLVPATQAALLTQLGAGGAAEVAELLSPLSLVNAALLAAVLALSALFVRRAARAHRTETWGCGYAAPSPRMQYGGSSFSELLVARATPRWLRAPRQVRPPDGPFPVTATFVTEASDPLTRGAYEPLLARSGDRFSRLRFLQQGNVHVYILYIVAAAIGALAWAMVRDWWLT